MQTTYNGEHSIIFGDKDAWTEWGLVPVSRPSVAMPSVRENMIEIPGMNGLLDLTDIPLGYPTYGSRSGSWTFYIAHDVTGQSWDETYALVSAYLHGKRRTCILTDDRSYFYTGRFSVDDISSDKMASQITINYTLDPFKWMRWTTCEDWPWNPFDFIYGEITQDYFKNIPITQNTAGNYIALWRQNEIGTVPVVPTFTLVTVDSHERDRSVTITITNSINEITRTIEVDMSGSGVIRKIITDPLVELTCPSTDDTTTITAHATGFGDTYICEFSIDFRPGRL